MGCPLAVLVMLGATAGTAAGQDPCPSASGVEAEAGWQAYAANDMDAARERFVAALSRCPNDQYARTGLGYVELRAGYEAGAEGLWWTVLEAEPNNVDALVGLGLARWRAGDLQGVEDRFRRVLELSPEHPTALDYLARVEHRSGAADGADGGDAADAADAAWLAGDSERARVLYEARLSADPDDGTALLRVGLMHAWEGEYELALSLIGRVLARYPDDLDARMARARIRAWTGDLDRARSEVREILVLDPGNTEALTALAQFQSWAGEHEEALARYDELLTIAPEGSGIRRRQAQALAWSSDFTASIGAYERLVAADPDDMEARYGLAVTLAYAGRFEEAVRRYEEIRARAPDDLRADAGVAKVLAWSGRLIESEETAREAIAEHPGNAGLWGELGRTLRLQGRLGDAKVALDRAEALDPTDADIRDQARSLRLALAPVARPSFAVESDSERNRMRTTTLSTTVRATPHLEVHGQAYWKDLDQGVLGLRAVGARLGAAREVGPGWIVSGDVGGSDVDAPSTDPVVEYRVGVRTPDRHAAGVTVAYESRSLNETALLAQGGVTSSRLLVLGRWLPARFWRVDGSVGVGSYDGRERNGRRSAAIAASRQLGPDVSVGVNLRGFSFEKDLVEGYFDPDFYGIAELAGYWRTRPGDWSLLVELAPGVQQIRRDGPTSTTLRSNLRVGYAFAPGREVSLSYGYSSAGLVRFASPAEDYSYSAVILGSSWVF